MIDPAPVLVALVDEHMADILAIMAYRDEGPAIAATDALRVRLAKRMIEEGVDEPDAAEYSRRAGERVREAWTTLRRSVARA